MRRATAFRRARAGPAVELALQRFRPGPYMHSWNVWLDR